MTIDSSDCQRFDDDVAALALGTITGRQRADVIDHVESCRSCEALLEALSATSDHLLELAPVVEPPVGFEVRVLDRIHETQRARVFRSRRRVALLAVAAIAIAVLGFTAGDLFGNGSPSHVNFSANSVLESRGRTVGELSVRSGSPARLVVKITHLNRSGPVVCRVTDEDGRSVTLGIFWLYDGSGSWTVTMPFPARELRSATISTESGVRLASARLD